MRHSGWYPDRIVRLFRRGSARFSEIWCTSPCRCAGRSADWTGELLHESVADFEAVLDKVNRYSTAGARDWTGAA